MCSITLRNLDPSVIQPNALRRMQTQGTENNFNSVRLTTAGQQKMDRQSRQGDCRLLRLTPLICVLVGLSLTVLGHAASITICKVVGPVFIAIGAFLLVFVTLWNSRRDVLNEGMASSCEAVIALEQNASEIIANEGPDPDQPGSIHHVEVWIPPEPSGTEIIPPSYEEATQQ